MSEAMPIHVLPGDSLLGPFNETGIEGSAFVCRECLVDGDVSGESLEEFWHKREKYLAEAYPEAAQDYTRQVADQFRSLIKKADGKEVNLWFEYELFCQVNLWFTVWLLRDSNARIRLIYPKIENKKDIWNGFAALNTDELKGSFEEGISMEREDIALACDLWAAFRTNDSEKLSLLGSAESKCFPTLDQVTQAAGEIDTQPLQVMNGIVDTGIREFSTAFVEFSRMVPVYGFGDLQVKRIFEIAVQK